jgi:DNA polymerase III epsilon subunit-like protein
MPGGGSLDSRSVLLRDIDVLVLDCQATGATPAHGDLLELGWAVCGAQRFSVPARAHWIVPRTDRGVSRAVRKLTGWDDDCLAESVDAAHAFRLLHADACLARGEVPTVIHFARFELPFLRELHAHAGDAEQPFPFDTVCLHAVAQRLFPDLPRRNLRALAGHLGHSPELVRRATGHVEASAFIWQALLPVLEQAGARTWDELKTWLEAPAPAPATRTRTGRGRPGYPLSEERRRALPDAPGVYRFLRPNGDVLYVGKAASLKKRVASHFTTRARATERALEMLTQAHDVQVTTTATALEAALLETDEIKRLDPPYNVQLRAGDRQAWFASRDWSTSVPAPDDDHRVGPLPSRAALSGIAAVRALLEGAEAIDARRAAAVGVPRAFAPDASMFDEVWRIFAPEHLGGDAPARTRILRAADRIVIEDEETADDPGAEAPPSGWDRERVRRYLERTVVQEGRLVRRARALSLLANAAVVFREPRASGARALVLERGRVIDTRDVAGVVALASLPSVCPPSRHARQAAFDAALYDRLRVLATELRRVAEQGGEVAFRLGRRQAGV